ncbi:MAG: putative inner rane transporter YedA [Pseudomonadota bacterium]
MHQLSQRQWVVLILLTIVWGINWPIMKLGVQDYPPLTFRAICALIGLPLFAGVLWRLKVGFRIPREHWREVFELGMLNMVLWHGLIILAVKALSSGRAAILGYTMPIFSAILGAWLFGNALSPRAWLGVGAATVGVLLLLWHEITQLSGQPVGVGLALVAAAAWALGTHRLRRTPIQESTLTIVFWMTAMTLVAMVACAFIFERHLWRMPAGVNWIGIAFNGILIYAFSQAAWFYLARSLPPLASTLSVMMIPILGVFSGAWWLGEMLKWQDWAAVALMVVSIASVLLPRRA